MTETIMCILVDKKHGDFIGIIDQYHRAFELRTNDEDPFVLPFDDIEEGFMFIITHETKPGQLIVTVTEAEIADYYQLVNDTYAIDGLYMWAENISSASVPCPIIFPSKLIDSIEGLKGKIELLRTKTSY